MEDGAPGSWVRDATAGDPLAWGRLVDRYNSMVWSIARSFNLSTPDASDIVQTTWLRLVEHLDGIKDPDRVGAWLATTARNECLAHLRRRGRHGVASGDVTDIVDVRAVPEEPLLAAERDTALWSALREVPERCRRLLRILASDPPPSYHEVGAVLDMPVGSIGATRARCLEKLRHGLVSDPRNADLLDSR